MKIIKLGILGLALSFCGVATAQSISSPYTNNGVGEFLYQGLPHNFAMGQIGIGTPTPWHINLQNPALLTYNRLSSFQVGLQSDIRKYSTKDDNSKSQSGSLRFLALSFPVINNRWTSAIAVMPLTTVNYNTNSQRYLDLEDSVLQQIRYEGSGGLTQIQWANGVRVLDRLTVGFKAAYVFGNIDKASNIYLQYPDLLSNSIITYYDRSHYSDINLSIGLSYQTKLGEKSLLTIGMVHGLSQEIEGTRDLGFERITSVGTIQTEQLEEDVPVSFSMPKSYEFGVSYDYQNKFTFGVDLGYQDWENTTGSDVRNTLFLGAGLQYIPDFQSVNSYLKRAVYRLGFNMKQLPYVVNNTEINDFGINFGASFPVSGLSSLDAAFKYGFRGTTDNDLIKENYFQVVIGATINDKWFIKRRYD